MAKSRFRCAQRVTARLLACAAMELCIAMLGAGAQAATTTTLAITSGGGAVTTVAAGSVVTLTATVSSSGSHVTAGAVNFCDAAAAHCTDVHLLGTSQLTSSGKASIRFVPGIGSHTYKAVFAGTSAYGLSASAASPLAVTGLYPTATTIAQSGTVGHYTLTATVAGLGPVAPTGNVSFVDTSNSNAVLGTAALGAGSYMLSLVTASTPAEGNGAAAIAVADFNRDGKLDMAVANYGGNNVTILLGDGTGNFAATSISPPTGNGPIVIAAGDFNNDGIPDLAVANYSDGTVTILLGHGDGTFTATATSPPVGTDPDGIAVGDFNGDGNLDLAVANYGSNTVTILLGDGHGHFTADATSPATGNQPSSIATADFNGDGIPDLAVTNFNKGGAGSVTVLIGKGDGTFTATSVSPATGSEPNSIVAADFTGSGKLGLAISNFTGETVTVLLGNGDGTFTLQSSPATGNGPYSVAVGDFNGDGIPDLATANYDDNTATVLLGDGSGNFTSVPAASIPPMGINPISVAVGDFNNDGVPGLAVANYNSATMTVLSVAGSQVATATVIGIAPAGLGAHQLAASYLGDTANAPSVSGTTGLTGQALTTTTLAVTSAGSPVTAVTWGTAVKLTATVAISGTPVTTGQVNFCDAAATHCTDIHLLGRAQLTSAGSAAINLVPGIGSHTYKAEFAGITASAALSTVSVSGIASLTVTGTGPTATAIAQSGSPGNYTLTAMVTNAGTTSPTGTVSFLDTSDSNAVVATAPLGAGAAGLYFLSSSTPVSNSTSFMAAGDFNGDGILDLVVSDGDWATTNILLGNGDGTFTQGASFGGSGTLAVGDFNGDGIPDVAVGVTVLLGNGNGTFTGGASLAGSSNNTGVAVGDFNGDGILDLAVTGWKNGIVQVYLGNGDGTFTPGSGYYTGNVLAGIAVGDFNGDGNLDLAVGAVLGPGVDIYLGNGDGTFTAASGLPTNAEPNEIAVADFNGDGILDLAAGGTVFLGNGDGTFTQAASLPVGGPMAVGDFNGDGIPDLASGGAVFLGKGDGTFTQVATLAAAGPWVVGDFNGDGLPDLAVPNYSSGSIGTAVALLAQNQAAIATATGVSPAGTGTHLIEASYPGDTNYGSSASGTTPLTAELLPPRMTLISSADQVKAGAPVTFTATVTLGAPPPKSKPVRNPHTKGTPPVPTGTMTFYLDKTSIGSIKLNAKGQAIFSTINLPSGTDSITANYSGDKNYEPTTSAPVTVTVAPKLTPAAKLTTSATTTNYGGLVTFTAELTSSGGTPAGTVTFLDGAAVLDKASLSSSGAAIYATRTLAVGKHSITVSYAGDPQFAAAISGAVSVTVSKATPTDKLTSSATTTTYGGLVTLTATVTGSGETPAGTVEFYDGKTLFAAVNLNSTGEAAYSKKDLAAGKHTITASYGGNSDYAAATSAAVSVTVNKATPAIALKASAASVTIDSTVILTATVTGTAITPQGTVNFLDGAAKLGSATVSASGVATYATKSLSAGKHSITASYAGNSDYAAATSAAVSVTVNKATPSIALKASTSTADVNTTVTFTATVTGSALAKPTGTVNFLDGTTKLGPGTLNSSGVATYSTSKLAAGKHSVTADYTGSSDYTAKNSTAVSVTVTAP